MSLNSTPKSDRIHIGIFGRRNAGKSSLINAITGQPMAIVSDIKGTTTDPVSKAMEILPMGPVLITDTPGMDDDSELGAARIAKAVQVLNKTDICVLVVDAGCPLSDEESELIDKFRAKGLPFIVAANKSDLYGTACSTGIDNNTAAEDTAAPVNDTGITHGHPKTDSLWQSLKDRLPSAENLIYVSAKTGENIFELKELIAKQIVEREKFPILKDLIAPGDNVVLVIPIDSAAPKGRIILPQQQALREVLDAGAVAIVTRETELAAALNGLQKPPTLVVTDSQAFGLVSKIVPEDVPLTGFSVLFARHKGDLRRLYEDVKVLDTLKEGDTVLISEGCTHHRQCDDIGTVKMPAWIKKYTGIDNLNFEFTSGTDFPENLSNCKLVVHCGGCMLNEREMKYRISTAKAQNTPIVNYGIIIAYMNGILDRAVAPFKGNF
ncbi:MAG: [FeFe] hydrogenase H-cluster maturation GTPase HydF [Oscillospiraceae bacterium]|jgi:small GTP-binding protein|nr:[FeFe] hydrogenase H-cluster maturation GTPase HydF [Oscillospiraceae bacterium]